MTNKRSKIAPKAKIENIQALRGVAALMVFFAHIIGAESDYGGGEQILPTFLNMGVTGVDLFFLISGFIMVYVTRDLADIKTAKGATPSSQNQSRIKKLGCSKLKVSSSFFLRRAARIYPLYWVMTLSLLILYAGKKALFAEDTIITNYVSSFLLIPDTQFPIIPVGWTLVYEMYFYVIFSLCLLFQKKYLPPLLGLWAVIITIGWLTSIRTINPWFTVIFSPLNFEFLFGALIAYLALNKKIFNPKLLMLVAIISLGVLLIPFADILYPQALTNHAHRAALMTLPFGLLLYASVGFEWRSSNQENAKLSPRPMIAPRWLIIMGDASYALYLVHIPVFLVTGKMISLVSGTGIIDNIILIIVYVVTGIGAALITHFYIEKPLNKWVLKNIVRPLTGQWL